jgi:hypothetical protein
MKRHLVSFLRSISIISLQRLHVIIH